MYSSQTEYTQSAHEGYTFIINSFDNLYTLNTKISKDIDEIIKNTEYENMNVNNFNNCKKCSKTKALIVATNVCLCCSINDPLSVKKQFNAEELFNIFV